METILTHTEDLGSMQSLDYIFECFYDEEIINENPENEKITMDKESINVEKFLLKDMKIDCNYDQFKRRYTQLSDHYGISCGLIYNGKEIIFYFRS